MKYVIKKDFNGSNTGFDFVQFKAGKIMEMSDSLAVVALREGWAEETKEPVKAIEPEIEPETAIDIAEPEQKPEPKKEPAKRPAGKRKPGRKPKAK